MYTTEERTPEIILQIIKPDGIALTTLNGLNYVTVGDTSGFDITKKKGLVKIALDKVIEVLENNTTHKIEEEWNISIIFVNLETNQAKNAGKKLSSQVIVQQENFTFIDFCDEDTLTCQIAKKSVADNIQSEYVESKTGIDFSQISSDTNGKGIYVRAETMNDEYPIYYYRGDVTDNNIKYANFCWKMVRTTETGGTKLIYNGLPDTEGKCTNTTGESTQIGNIAFNSSSNSPSAVGYMYGIRYEMKFKKEISSLKNNLIFGNDITYDDTTKTYNLKDTIEISPMEWDIKYTTINNNHYTFLDSTDKSKVFYVYYTDSNNAYYIELTGGKKIEDALEEMFNINPNQTSSTIKIQIDDWYKNSIENTESELLLEDTIWCNDRSIRDYGGWNPNGGSTINNYTMYFSPNGRSTPMLECSRVEDRFTKEVKMTEDGKKITNGALDYPIGLLTSDEVKLAGGTDEHPTIEYYLNTFNSFRLLSPSYIFYPNASTYIVTITGKTAGSNVGIIDYGVRPSVSLATDVVITNGDGTPTNPYEVAFAN